jgi:hypothetical protein
MAVLTNFGVPVSGESGTTLMPKLQYRFRVTFSNLGGSSKATVITRNVVSVTRPSLEHDDVTVDTYNSKIRLAGKHMWQDISLVIRDDVDSGVIKELGAQIAKQVDHADQAVPTAGEDYKFGMKIEMLDGGNAGSENVIDEWVLSGCFIPSIQYGDLNYATSEVVQVTASIRYDNASHEVNGGDQISGLILGNGSTAA